MQLPMRNVEIISFITFSSSVCRVSQIHKPMFEQSHQLINLSHPKVQEKSCICFRAPIRLKTNGKKIGTPL